MMTKLDIYTPREDSTMLEQHVRRHAKGSVLDVGAGSGVQAIAAAKNKKVNSVLATDIHESVIRHCKDNIKNKKITFIVSDLFEAIKSNSSLKHKVFDTIIFNPPYLPSELKVRDLTLEGGKKGYEVIERFLNHANAFLKTDGIILIIFSSLTKKDKVEEFIKNNMLEFELLDKQHYFFEDLYAYKIVKSEILKDLEKRGIANIQYFAKGKRGLVFTGNYRNKKVAIKTSNIESKAAGRIENEISFLKKINRKNIGPKLLLHGRDFFAYNFVDGVNIHEFLVKPIKNKKILIKTINNILNQMFILDKLKINKEEMSHPIKHILIDKKNNPTLIDFERCHYTLIPSNVTQFCDFLISKNILSMLKNNNILINKNKIINSAKQYKHHQNKNNLNSILKLIK